ncbi:MAG: SagB/ThcOx family dehydrogenase [Deltaproteobacteria bacterium]|nr:SagB/ThcOx family dehydrogenase [Deltaproteobacteria bacterium]
MNAATYHNHTRYSRHRMTPHRLDWENVPLQHKAYHLLHSVELHPSAAAPAASLVDLFDGNTTAAHRAMNIEDLATILSLANGVTAKRHYGSQTMLFRSSPSAGALYPNEIYVASGSVDGLDPGLYNFQVPDASLEKISDVSMLAGIDAALTNHGGPLPVVSMPVTAIFFRSAWKYRARAFRYVLLDAGHLIENLVLAIVATGFRASVHYDFDDDAMTRCLGIDAKREVCLAIINLYGIAHRAAEPPVGGDQPSTPEDRHTLLQDMAGTSRVAAVEKGYDAILAAYRAGKATPSIADDGTIPHQTVGTSPRSWFPLRDPGLFREAHSYVKSVARRRSRRNFVPRPLNTSHAMALLKSLCPSNHPDADDGDVYGGCVASGFAAVNVEGFDPGIYLLDAVRRAYGPTDSSSDSGGALGLEIARTCLDQAWLKNGALHVVFMANLSCLDRHYGARGYRYAMMNAGRAGQRIYLAATALGCGVCGIGAIYDDEAARLLALNKDSALLYLVAVGDIQKAIP